ncbi:MAG: thioredoxin family protein [Planctomycetaceae bacterium]|nr:thioredoxin family protein [Planctomycetaceae bacterium]
MPVYLCEAGFAFLSQRNQLYVMRIEVSNPDNHIARTEPNNTKTMQNNFYRNGIFALLFAIGLICSVPQQSLFAQDTKTDPQLLTALKFKPLQKDVEYDIPTDADVPQCKISIYDNKRGYIVTGVNNITLRIFVDNNSDGNIDQWSYYRNGIEVYRDVDTDGNHKADQFRWLNHGGTRIGIDINNDFIIDYWKNISPEEVSREIIAAVTTNDTARFLRVTLSNDELQSLGLGTNLNDNVAKKIAALRAGFDESVKAMNLNNKMQWYQLNAGFPGTIPAKTNGNAIDLTAYENTVATVGDGKETRQISIGTIVKLADNNWRVLDVPKLYDESGLPSYTFIPPAALPPASTQQTNTVLNLINEYHKIAATIDALPAEQRPAQHKKAVIQMLQIIKSSETAEDRELWIRIMADEIMQAAQDHEFPEAEGYIEQIYKSIADDKNDELAAYVRHRQIMIEHYSSVLDDVKAYSKWIENLEGFVTDKRFETTEIGLDVMMQLAANREMSSRTIDEPLKWYARIVDLAGNKPIAAKANGAIRRLKSEGQAIPFQGNDINNKRFDITSLKGNYVLICFWDSYDDNALVGIKRTTDQLANAGLKVVGVNLDTDIETLKQTTKKLGLDWIQIFAQGGLDSKNATDWGIQNLPTMILYGKDGTVLRANASINEIQNIINNNK